MPINKRARPEITRLATRRSGSTEISDIYAGYTAARPALSPPNQGVLKAWRLAVAHPLPAQHGAAFGRRAVLALDGELAQALVACRLVADLGLCGDARRLVRGRACGGCLEDPILLRPRREGAAVLGEVVGGRIDQALQGRFVGLDADLAGRRRHRLHALHRRLVGDLPQTGLDGSLRVG